MRELAFTLALLPSLAFAQAVPVERQATPQELQQRQAPDFRAIALQQEMRAAQAEGMVLELQKRVEVLEKQLAEAAKKPDAKPADPPK